MSNKKEVKTTEQARAELLDARNIASKAFDKAKAEYSAFCKENPLKVGVQPTVHELRLMSEKRGSKTSAEHARVNAAQASKVARDNLLKSAKG